MGKDDRFDDKRDDFFRFLAFLDLPDDLGLGCFSACDGLEFAKRPAISSACLWDRQGYCRHRYLCGLAMETITDFQKYYFRTDSPRSAICDKGVFSWSRHPNYFGEIITQFGMVYLIFSQNNY